MANFNGKSSAYVECYEKLKTAKYSEPTDTEKLASLRSFYGDELYKECLNGIREDLEAELDNMVLCALEEQVGQTVQKDANGGYYTEIYADYNDCLSDEQVAEILGASNIPRDYFYDKLFELYCDCQFDEEDNLLEKLKENDAISTFLDTYKMSEDTLADSLREKWSLKLPIEHYLKQEFCMDLIIDAGDANYDFTLNDFGNAESIEEISDASSILWLCKTQGITKEELFATVSTGKAYSNEYTVLQNKFEEIKEQLRGLGRRLKEEHFGLYRPHEDPYYSYQKLLPDLDKLKKQYAVLSSRYKTNDITYEKYVSLFPPAKILPDEETFETKKVEILSSCLKKMEETQEKITTIENLMGSNKDFVLISQLLDAEREVKAQIKDYVEANKAEFKKATFLNSVRNEMLNTYGIAHLTFLLKTTLDEAISIQEMINEEKEINESVNYEERSGKSSIDVLGNVTCGLMDCWNGKGSLFEIKLIKDEFEIPIKAIHSFAPDNCPNNYGIWGFQQVYGTNDEYYLKSLRRINHEPIEKDNKPKTAIEQYANKHSTDKSTQIEQEK